MTLFSKFLSFSRNFCNLLNKVIIITSGDNEYIHLVNFLCFHEIFEIASGDNGNCTSKHLLNKKMTMYLNSYYLV